MDIPPQYQITPTILELIAKIDALRLFFSALDLPIVFKQKIQRTSLLKSSLYSARIEGNPLTLKDIESGTERIEKLEISNILDGNRYIERSTHSDITSDTILQLHEIVMKNIHGNAGQFRREMGAIFNEAGVAVYVAPPPFKIKKHIDSLLAYIHSDVEIFPLIAAFIAHLIFEKIHPFEDGNGRVGRLLIPLILKSKQYDAGFTVPFEEYLDNHKSDYYDHLDRGLIDTQSYIQFMLGAYYEELLTIKNQIENNKTNEISLLPPRQEEIYNIIKEHTLVSLDFIHRRFFKVPKRTIRYDLKKLHEADLIVKIGKTRGSLYRVKDNT